MGDCALQGILMSGVQFFTVHYKLDTNKLKFGTSLRKKAEIELLVVHYRPIYTGFNLNRFSDSDEKR